MGSNALEVTHEFCEQYADELMALAEPDRLVRIWAMGERAVREDAPGFPIIVGLVLRDRGIIDWAEYVFNVALRIPGARAAALFELSMAASVTGRVDEAAILLARLAGEHPLSPLQERAYAHVLVRKGDLEGAVVHLEKSRALEPWAVGEHVAYRQFFDYFLTYPFDEAIRRCTDLLASYRFRSPSDVAEDVMAAVRDSRPYSLIRVNDGEGAFCNLSLTDEARYSELYLRARREFHVSYWYGHDEKLSDPDYWRVVREFEAVLPNADCLGAYHNLGLQHEYRWASLRNVPCLFNVVRKLEQISKGRDFEPGRIGLCDPTIGNLLLYEGHLERMIGSQERLGLISCHVDLPGALKERFGLSEVVYHRTPGEPPLPGAGNDPLPVWHARLSAEVAQARPGILYLVAAGMPGKIYCDVIKRAGGVALDIGSVADIWMKTRNRTYFHDVSGYALAG